jgi:peptidoglycan/LPS O-acetylase OafA/YrhL
VSRVSARVPALDGLRLCCCLFVVVGHTAWGPVLGRLASFGVDVFFSLSGFLITGLLLRERRSRGSVDLGSFYARRALRIAPVYYASLLAAFGLTWLLGDAYAGPFRGPQDERFFTSTLGAYALFLGNWTEAPVPSPVEVLWSVCVEEQFYLLFPLCFARSSRKYPVLLPAAAGLAAAWACRIWLASRGDAGLFRNPLAHADGLLLGALLAQAVEAAPARVAALFARRAWPLESAAIVGAALHVVLRSPSTSPLSYWGSFLLSALAATALVAAMALGRGPAARALATPTLAWAGTLTYAGYVVHMYAVTAAFGICRVFPAGNGELAARLAVSVALTFALAWATHVAVERPFLRRKQALAPPI